MNIFIVILSFVCLLVSNFAYGAESFTTAAMLNQGRVAYHSATRLADGSILFTGGLNNFTIYAIALSSAERFFPAEGRVDIVSSMNVARTSHQGTLLNNGMVLISGGSGATAEIFDPVTNTFSYTKNLQTQAQSFMTVARAGHVAIKLSSGKVLLIGGDEESTSELYDPATGLFSKTKSVSSGLDTKPLVTSAGLSAIALNDGRILIVGGSAAAEIFDPATGEYSALPPMPFSASNSTLTLLADGRALITGGFPPQPATSLFVPDGTSGYFVVTQNDQANQTILNTTRSRHTASKLIDGRVLVAGGSNDSYTGAFSEPMALTEIFQPTTGIFSSAANMTDSHMEHSATVDDGTPNVYIATGRNGVYPSTRIEKFSSVSPAATPATFIPPVTEYSDLAVPTANGTLTLSYLAGSDGNIAIQHFSDAAGTGTWTIQVFDETNTELLKFTSTNNSIERLGVAGNRTYQIKITGTTTAKFDIKVYKGGGVYETEPNDESLGSTILTLGTAVKGRIASKTTVADVDYFKFHLDQQSVATITFSNDDTWVNSSATWFIDLYADPASGPLISKDMTTSLTEKVFLPAGDYYLKVTEKTSARSVLFKLLVTSEYAPVIPVVTASPAQGEYNGAQSVVLSAPWASSILYSINSGTPVTKSGTNYTTPITVFSNSTLSYYGRDANGVDSPIQTEQYTIHPKLSIAISGSGGAVTINPGGLVCPPNCDTYWNAGNSVSLVAKDVGNWAFSRWSGGCAGLNATCSSFAMSLDTQVTAAFSDKPVKNKTRGDFYDSLPLAYAAPGTASSDTIQIKETTFTQDVTFSGVRSITVNGGYDNSFKTQSGVTTFVGSMTIAVTTGSYVTLGNICIR